MDKDNDAGKKAAFPFGSVQGERSGSPRFMQQMAGSAPASGKRLRPHPTAMSQQSSDSGRGTESLPQKLVQLVGYRDPNACRENWVRPRYRVQR